MPKDADEAPTTISDVSFTSPSDRLSELEYFLILSKDLDYINEQAYKEQLKTIQQVKKMLSALIQKLS